jgi:hypothetical protein
VTVCDTSIERLEEWLKDQFSLKNCDDKKIETNEKENIGS